jgi:hypothetical protein
VPYNLTVAQGREGLAKSLLFLELGLRICWLPTPDELRKAIAASPYAGTTDRNEWMERAVPMNRRVIYIAAEGRKKMHKARSKAIMKNNMGIRAKAERARITERFEVVSLRSDFAEICASNPAFEGNLSFFDVDKQGRVASTPFYAAFVGDLRQRKQRIDAAVAAVEADDTLLRGDKDAMVERLDQERVGFVIVDPFSRVWGLGTVDEKALPRANGIMQAELDALGIAMVVVAHTNKSEDVEKDDHRAAGKGGVEMHSTVEHTLYMRPVTNDEYDRLQQAGEKRKQKKYIAFRVGKTNFQYVDENIHLLEKIDDGAPVCITKRLGLLGAESDGSRGGFSRGAVLNAVCSAVQFLEQAHGKKVTPNSLQKAFDDDHDGIMGRYKALKACGRNGSGGKEWQTATLLRELASDGCLEVKTGNGAIYSYIRHPQEAK